MKGEPPQRGELHTTLGGAWCTPLFDTRRQNSTGVGVSVDEAEPYRVLRAELLESGLSIVALPAPQVDGLPSEGEREWERQHAEERPAGPSGRAERAGEWPEGPRGGFRS